jgi:peptide subunit release factor RF-3
MLSEDQRWIYEHFNELVDNYPGKYISVAGGGLVAVGDSVREVDDAAREKFPSIVPSILRVPKKEDFECLL